MPRQTLRWIYRSTCVHWSIILYCYSLVHWSIILYCYSLVHWSIICLRASYEDANAAIDTDLRFPPFIFEIC